MSDYEWLLPYHVAASTAQSGSSATARVARRSAAERTGWYVKASGGGAPFRPRPFASAPDEGVSERCAVEHRLPRAVLDARPSKIGLAEDDAPSVANERDARGDGRAAARVLAHGRAQPVGADDVVEERDEDSPVAR